jgi:hypothetical protein
VFILKILFFCSKNKTNVVCLTTRKLSKKKHPLEDQNSEKKKKKRMPQGKARTLWNFQGAMLWMLSKRKKES